ncbi:MAG TPA: hypothetical protein VJB88_08340 [Vicinamibacteria bacterium]|nr:hypothetical protein [Vicinamibacteria bacterium]
MYAQRSLSSVTVRRLKEDLRKLNIESFPERKVVQIDLRHYDRSWERRDSEGEWRSISPEKAAPPSSSSSRRSSADAWLSDPRIEPGTSYVLFRNGNSWKFGGVKRVSA